MGYLPPAPPPRLNVDRFGMPLDYATYMWVMYRQRVKDGSPARLAFLHGPSPLYASLVESFYRFREAIEHPVDTR